MSEQERTGRGFRLYDVFPDMYGNTVRVQQSSNVKGGCWIFTDHRTAETGPSPHLSKDDAWRLIAALHAYIDDEGAA